MEENNIKVKIIKIALLGDSFVGKTWICKSFTGVINHLNF
jgi:GTPase SAR1 family protein